jgi:putative inorganic carbon (HCO3(-)) transporter
MDINTTTDTSPQFGKQNTKEKIFKILNLSVPILMGIFIFFNPFPHTTSIKEICFYGSVIIVLILICFKKIDFSFKSPLTLPFALFTAWAFIGLFFALDKGNSIHDFYAHLLKYLAIYYILINFFNSRKRLMTLAWIIVASTLIFTIGAMGYFYIILGNSFQRRLLFSEPEIMINGFMTTFALLLSLHLFLKENLCRKFILSFPIIILPVASILVQCRATLLSMIVAVPILLLHNKKRFIAFFVCIIIAVATISPFKSRLIHTFEIIQQNKIQTMRRVKIWRTYFEAIKDYPISGIGFGMEKFLYDQDFWHKYNAKLPDKFREKQDAPHNMIVSVTTRLGFVGLILFFYIIFVFTKISWITIKHGKDSFIKRWGLCVTAAFIAYFIEGMLGPALHHAPAIILYTIFAMMTILWKLDSESNFQALQNQ